MREYIKKIRSYYFEHQNVIKPGIIVAGKCIEHVANLSQLSNPTPYSYINTVFKCKEAYEGQFHREGNLFFSNKNWETFLCEECWPAIVQLLQLQKTDQIKKINKKSGSSKDLFTVYLSPECQIGWMMIGSTCDGIYVSRGKLDEAVKLIQKLLWENLKLDCIKIDIIKQSYRAYFDVNLDTGHFSYRASPEIDKWAAILRDYRQRDYGKSVIFYGPPGSGKSNLVRGISNVMGLRTVRLNNLNEVRHIATNHIINLLDPDLIILEDIDHMYSYEIHHLLEKLDDLNNRRKFILATANEITKVNNALIRPNRFDQLIEIKNLDRDHIWELVKQDEEIFERVQTWPVAFINEFMKRVIVEGKDKALSEVADLERRVKKLEDANYKL